MESYAAVLAKLVSDSGMTLREISDQCRKQNVAIDPSYISRLQTGRQAPASDAVNTAIAEACGVEPDELLIAAYAEKAPAFVQNLIDRIARYLREFTKDIINQRFPETLAKNKISALDKLSSWSFVYHVINEPEYKAKHLSGPFDPTRNRNLFTFTMPDNSLAEIPCGAKVVVTKVQGFGEISIGDYVLIALPDGTHLVRRYLRCADQVVLLADNVTCQSYELDEENMQVLGKVIFIEPHLFT